MYMTEIVEALVYYSILWYACGSKAAIIAFGLATGFNIYKSFLAARNNEQ